MSEDHRDIQTPKNSSNRKAKPINNPMKKLNQHKQKSIKRNLSAGFTPITEDDVASNPSDKELIKKISSISASVDVHQSTVEISKANLNSVQEDLLQYPEQSIEISSVLEDYVSNEDRFTESMKSYIVSAKQLSSLSAAATSLVELTPSSSSSSSSSSSLITAEDAAAFINSATHVGDTTKDIESLANDLRECRKSMCQVLNSADLEPKYKKLFDALVKMDIEDSYSLHEDNHTLIVMLSFVLAAIVAGLVGFFLFSDAQSFYYGPPPT